MNTEIQAQPAADAADPQLQVQALEVAGARTTLAALFYQPKAQDKGRDRGSAKCCREHLIVFFHAGGFVCGSIEEADGFCRALAKATGFAVLSCSYTLAGSAPFPAAADDAYAALCWARREHKQLQWNGKHLLVAGIEAGGNLAAVAALMARDRAEPKISAQILLMPMLDAALSCASMRTLCDQAQGSDVVASCNRGYRDYLPNPTDRAHPYASPLQSSRLKGLPPALILSTHEDPLRDEGRIYADKLQAAQVVVHAPAMPPAPIQTGIARCCCARQKASLQEIVMFLQSLGLKTAGI